MKASTVFSHFPAQQSMHSANLDLARLATTAEMKAFRLRNRERVFMLLTFHLPGDAWVRSTDSRQDKHPNPAHSSEYRGSKVRINRGGVPC